MKNVPTFFEEIKKKLKKKKKSETFLFAVDFSNTVLFHKKKTKKKYQKYKKSMSLKT